MILCLYHSQTFQIGLTSMRRLCNRCLISSIWALVLWLVVLKRRTACKGVDSSEMSSIICNGLVVLFGGQAALDAGKSCMRWIFNGNDGMMVRIGRNEKTKLPSGDRSRLDRAGCNGVGGFAAWTANDNRSGGSRLFDCDDCRLCRDWAVEFSRNDLHRLSPGEALT